MLFNSLEFFRFFVVVYVIYLFLDHKWQNRMLLIASYVFYAAWDVRFLSLIVLSTTIDYICGLKIFATSSNKNKKFYLFCSVFANLVILGVFKYFDFFYSNIHYLFSRLGYPLDPITINIILPIGISFYTFQSMSYTIDIYRGELRPTRNFFDFALYVAYFPQLVAGPIERAKNLLPRIQNPRQMNWDKFSEGSFLILWGLFQKVFIADQLGGLVGPIFQLPENFSGVFYLLAIYAFAFQIYCDFAGYSNIARGLSQCMGIDLMVNFRFPYFATNPTDFWRRWHISLSSWLRDYLYIPLGGNHKGMFFTLRNLALTMLLGGLWHGAAWTFVLWGGYHGALLIIYRMLEGFAKRFVHINNSIIKNMWYLIRLFVFFHLICLGWLFFRAESLEQIYRILGGIINEFHWQQYSEYYSRLIFLLKHIWFLIVFDFFSNRRKSDVAIFSLPSWVRICIYLGLYLLITFNWENSEQEFIYFQF